MKCHPTVPMNIISAREQHKNVLFKNIQAGTSLVVQWVRLCAPTAGGTGSVPGGGTKIPHVTQLGQKKKRISKEIKITFKWHLCQIHTKILMKNRKAACGNKCYISILGIKCYTMYILIINDYLGI